MNSFAFSVQSGPAVDGQRQQITKQFKSSFEVDIFITFYSTWKKFDPLISRLLQVQQQNPSSKIRNPLVRR
jgi:hypothetical protein